MAQPAPAFDGLFDMLEERAVPADQTLPDTGVGIELERALAPAFIHTPEYGTRCSTLVVQHTGGRLQFAEREQTPGQPQTTRRFEIVSVAPQRVA